MTFKRSPVSVLILEHIATCGMSSRGALLRLPGSERTNYNKLAQLRAEGYISKAIYIGENLYVLTRKGREALTALKSKQYPPQPKDYSLPRTTIATSTPRDLHAAHEEKDVLSNEHSKILIRAEKNKSWVEPYAGIDGANEKAWVGTDDEEDATEPTKQKARSEHPSPANQTSTHETPRTSTPKEAAPSLNQRAPRQVVYASNDNADDQPSHEEDGMWSDEGESQNSGLDYDGNNHQTPTHSIAPENGQNAPGDESEEVLYDITSLVPRGKSAMYDKHLRERAQVVRPNDTRRTRRQQRQSQVITAMKRNDVACLVGEKPLLLVDGYAMMADGLEWRNTLSNVDDIYYTSLEMRSAAEASTKFAASARIYGVLVSGGEVFAVYHTGDQAITASFNKEVFAFNEFCSILSRNGYNPKHTTSANSTHNQTLVLSSNQRRLPDSVREKIERELELRGEKMTALEDDTTTTECAIQDQPTGDTKRVRLGNDDADDGVYRVSEEEREILESVELIRYKGTDWREGKTDNDGLNTTDEEDDMLPTDDGDEYESDGLDDRDMTDEEREELIRYYSGVAPNYTIQGEPRQDQSATRNDGDSSNIASSHPTPKEITPTQTYSPATSNSDQSDGSEADAAKRLAERKERAVSLTYTADNSEAVRYISAATQDRLSAWLGHYYIDTIIFADSYSAAVEMIEKAHKRYSILKPAPDTFRSMPYIVLDDEYSEAHLKLVTTPNWRKIVNRIIFKSQPEVDDMSGCDGVVDGELWYNFCDLDLVRIRELLDYLYDAARWVESPHILIWAQAQHEEFLRSVFKKYDDLIRYKWTKGAKLMAAVEQIIQTTKN